MFKIGFGTEHDGGLNLTHKQGSYATSKPKGLPLKLFFFYVDTLFLSIGHLDRWVFVKGTILPKRSVVRLPFNSQKKKVGDYHASHNSAGSWAQPINCGFFSFPPSFFCWLFGFLSRFLGFYLFFRFF
jgi:hypothetical protein